MLELPEALTVANQINSTIKGRKILGAVVDSCPHKFAWYHGDPKGYHDILAESTVIGAAAYGGMVHVKTDSGSIVIGDGVNLRYLGSGQSEPSKHQLLLELDDSSKVSASVQMYGGIWCFSDKDEFTNPYYRVSRTKPSPLSEDFSEAYFNGLISPQHVQKLSIKAFLATEQRIPGLGNGVLQDILWRAKLNPRRKVSTLKDENIDALFREIKAVLSEMAEFQGRDTEKDFLGNNGGYKTIMSKNNAGYPCPECGSTIKKENYLGGSVYYCEKCQPKPKGSLEKYR